MKDDKANVSIYDSDIHPLVERIALICRQNKIPMFLCVEEKKHMRRTSCVNKGDSDKIADIYSLNQSWDLDEFLFRTIEKAKKEGHNSKYLRSMGIPMNPSE